MNRWVVVWTGELWTGELLRKQVSCEQVSCYVNRWVVVWTGELWTGELLCEQVSGRAPVTSCSACCWCAHFVRTEWRSVCLRSLSIILAPSSLNLQCLICARSLMTPLQRRHSSLYSHLEWSVSYLCCVTRLCTLTWSGQCLTCVVSLVSVLSPGVVSVLPVLWLGYSDSFNKAFDVLRCVTQ